MRNDVNYNAPLEPDTVMLWRDSLYIRDAKYYKYGITKNPVDLPGTSSIAKQITYGKFAKNRDFSYAF